MRRLAATKLPILFIATATLRCWGRHRGTILGRVTDPSSAIAATLRLKWRGARGVIIERAVEHYKRASYAPIACNQVADPLDCDSHFDMLGAGSRDHSGPCHRSEQRGHRRGQYYGHQFGYRNQDYDQL